MSVKLKITRASPGSSLVIHKILFSGGNFQYFFYKLFGRKCRGLEKPPTLQACNVKPCPVTWRVTGWSGLACRNPCFPCCLFRSKMSYHTTLHFDLRLDSNVRNFIRLDSDFGWQMNEPLFGENYSHPFPPATPSPPSRTLQGLFKLTKRHSCTLG